MKTPIPFVDLHTQYVEIQDEVDARLRQVMESTAFSGGPFVAAFEKQFAAYCEVEHAVGVGSGTDALWLALLAMGVGPGDEVITTPMTFIATAEAIHFCGATPVFVDIDESTYAMAPEKLEAAISRRTKAIIPVHLYGQPADMISILDVAAQHGIGVLEDACQAHGARYAGRRAGSLGDAACFSFYPGKNLGAYGEAGAVVTRDKKLAERIRALRDHGQSQKNRHTSVGWNARMDGMQAAVLGVKLPRLDEWNESRREKARHYDRLLQSIDGLRTPSISPLAESVYHLYVVRTAHRDEVAEVLSENNISCGVHYPVPIHLQEAFRHLGHKPGDFPVTERCAKEVLSLPMYPGLSLEQIEVIASALQAAIGSKAQESIHV